MTLEEWKGLAVRIEAWWPGTRWDEAMFAVWFEDLERHEHAKVALALQELKRTHLSPFAPGIGQLLEILEGAGERPPTLSEVIAAAIYATGHHQRDPATGRWEPGLAVDVALQLGDVAGEFVRRVTPEQLLAEEIKPGSFAYRDYTATLESLYEAHRQGHLRIELEGPARPALESSPNGVA